MATLQSIPVDTTTTILTTPSASSESIRNFNVGTRKSKLALKQTELVLDEAAKTCPEYTFTVKARDTAAGDIDKVTPFKDMAVKNIWTHELETLMGEGNLDFLVHSLKGTLLNHCALSPYLYMQLFLVWRIHKVSSTIWLCISSIQLL